jgi:SAM-dependent methyltransferase
VPDCIRNELRTPDIPNGVKSLQHGCCTYSSVRGRGSALEPTRTHAATAIGDSTAVSCGRLSLDVGYAEGRLTRDLKELGQRIVGVDSSPTLVAAAREFDSSSADLAVAFTSLHDIDRMPTAVRERARVLPGGGRLCAAVVHPINSAGRFEQSAADAHFLSPKTTIPVPSVTLTWSGATAPQ